MPKSTPSLASKPTMATTAAAVSAPSSPPTTTTMTNEPTWLTGPALKAANEHTFATQRAKKAADRAKSKAPPRKASATTKRSSSSTCSSSPSGASAAATATFALSYSANGGPTMASVWAEVWDARKADDDTDWPELPTPLGSLSQRYWSPSASPADCALRPTQDREVPFAALVRPVKARNSKGKAKEGEFEFLPPVKNVIALDDADSNIPDEPWEYISSVGERDDEARKIFSYAEIVSKAA